MSTSDEDVPTHSDNSAIVAPETHSNNDNLQQKDLPSQEDAVSELSTDDPDSAGSLRQDNNEPSKPPVVETDDDNEDDSVSSPRHQNAVTFSPAVQSPGLSPERHTELPLYEVSLSQDDTRESNSSGRGELAQHSVLQDFQQGHANSSSFSSSASAGQLAASASSAAANASNPGTLNSFVDTLKYTKQLFQEKLGRASRTMEPILENKIDSLRETQIRLRRIVDVTQIMLDGFKQAFDAQFMLGDLFASLRHKHPELSVDLNFNAQTQKVLHRNGQMLIGAMEFFIKDLRTLSEKTTGDCLDTIKLMEQARVTYDACRLDVERAPAAATTNSSAQQQNSIKEEKLARAKDRYDQLKADVDTKLWLLHDNRIRVLKKQLLLFHNSIAAYFSGNQAALEGTMRQFSIHFAHTGTASTITSFDEMQRVLLKGPNDDATT